jgi:hypothetical protein
MNGKQFFLTIVLSFFFLILFFSFSIMGFNCYLIIERDSYHNKYFQEKLDNIDLKYKIAEYQDVESLEKSK